MKAVGAGGFGKVFLIKKEDSEEKYAMKVISLKNGELTKDLIREISLLYDIDHDHIVKLITVFVFEENLCLIMEYLKSDLQEEEFPVVPSNSGTKQVKKWMFQILSAVAYLHERNIVHRDLKPSNILIDKEKQLKLTDFGLSRGFLFPGVQVTPLIMDESQCTSKSVAKPQGNSVTESKDTLDEDEEGFVNDGGTGTDTPSQCTKDKGRKTTSEAWNYFTREEVNGVTRAVCKHCGVSLVTGGNSGTSHLLKHAKKVCSGRHLNLSRGQTTLRVKKDCDGSSSLEFSGKGKLKEFDQDFSRKQLVSMVIMHEYPLSIVDHIGFRRFVESLNSNFKIILGHHR